MVKVEVTERAREKEREREAEEKQARHERGSAPEETEAPGRGEEEDREVPLEKMTKVQLIGKVKELQESTDRNLDLYVRSQAEIENMKRRFQREKSEWIKFSNESLIKDLLPVLDNLEKALIHAKNDESLEALREGVELTLRGLKDVLERSGLEEVKALGEPFDPHFHEAVGEKVDDRVKSGTVLEEYQKGYLLNQRLIRPSMVVVSKNLGGEEPLKTP